MSVVYASISNLKRKNLWQKLSFLQDQHKASWCFIGDFNVILRSHEHKGSFSPARPQWWTSKTGRIQMNYCIYLLEELSIRGIMEEQVIGTLKEDLTNPYVIMIG